MKKIIIIIFLLLLLPLLGSGQGNSQAYYPHPTKIQTINITNNPIQNGWAVSGNTCAGCASVFYKVLRSSTMHQAEDGLSYYYYYFIFYSNSYYSNGNPAATYLTNAKFYENGAMRVRSDYLLIEINNQKFVAWLRSGNPNAAATFHVDQITVY
jgi:hypothetical protein